MFDKVFALSPQFAQPFHRKHHQPTDCNRNEIVRVCARSTESKDKNAVDVHFEFGGVWNPPILISSKIRALDRRWQQKMCWICFKNVLVKMIAMLFRPSWPSLFVRLSLGGGCFIEFSISFLWLNSPIEFKLLKCVKSITKFIGKTVKKLFFDSKNTHTVQVGRLYQFWLQCAITRCVFFPTFLWRSQVLSRPKENLHMRLEITKQ